jgi:exodeoxyribonuclease (lambda-induced)
VGFAFTEDRRFGCSVDGLIHRPAHPPTGGRRIWECKTIVSSDLLFTAVIDGDISEWRDQCLFNMCLLEAEAVELYLHARDLPELSRVIVIERDAVASELEALEADMLAFEQMVASNEALLRRAISGTAGPAAGEEAIPGLAVTEVTQTPELEAVPEPTF